MTASARALAFLAVAALALEPTAARADETYPARLQLIETGPSTYDVAFSVPIQAGRKLRAEPVLPEACAETSERAANRGPAGLTTTWTVDCAPGGLAGETIVIDGLFGSKTEVMVEHEGRDGRRHRVVLRPSRPLWLVPEPPATRTIVTAAGGAGMRRALRAPAAWIALLVLAALAPGARAIGAALLAFTVATAVGRWFAEWAWIRLDPHLAIVLVALAATVPAISLASRRDDDAGWLTPPWPAAALLGLVTAGAYPGGLDVDGLSRVEQGLSQLLFALGVGAGLVIIALTTRELVHVLRSRRLVGYLAGIAAVALSVVHLSGLWPSLPPFSRGAVALAMFAAVVTTAAPGRRPILLLPLVAAITAGLALGVTTLGLTTPSAPLAAAIAAAALTTCGLMLLAGMTPSLPTWLATAMVGGTAAASQAGSELAATASLPAAAAVGTGVVSITLAWAGLRGAAASAWPPRLVGAAAALLALIWRVDDYRDWLQGPVAADATLGKLRLPAVALALAAAAIITWASDHRGDAGGRRLRPALLLGLAFFALPLGTVSFRAPFFAARAPRGDEARRIVEQVLTDTYLAFNIADEGELYDRLAENVAPELVTDLYLDGRRRLTVGTREGAEVTVREVSVHDIGEPAGDDPNIGFAYPCRWVVTARVRHKQHIHYRENAYSGYITLAIGDDRWRIAGVELTSEERSVLPWDRS